MAEPSRPAVMTGLGFALMILGGIASAAGVLMLLSMAMDPAAASGRAVWLLLPLTIVAAAVFTFGLMSVRRRGWVAHTPAAVHRRERGPHAH